MWRVSAPRQLAEEHPRRRTTLSARDGRAHAPITQRAGLRADQERALYGSLRDVLNEGIERRGSSVDSYRAPEGRGEMQNFLNVYGKTGKPCPRCGRPTKRIVISARSTHFCSWCQRLPMRERTPLTDKILSAAR